MVANTTAVFAAQFEYIENARRASDGRIIGARWAWRLICVKNGEPPRRAYMRPTETPMDMEEKNQELSMVLSTVIPIAAVALVGILLYAFLPFWLFIVAIVVIAVVAAVPKTRYAVINAFKPPPDPDTNSTEQAKK